MYDILTVGALFQKLGSRRKLLPSYQLPAELYLSLCLEWAGFKSTWLVTVSREQFTMPQTKFLKYT